MTTDASLGVDVIFFKRANRTVVSLWLMPFGQSKRVFLNTKIEIRALESSHYLGPNSKKRRLRLDMIYLER